MGDPPPSRPRLVHRLLIAAGRILTWPIYRVRTRGLEHVPLTGGALLVPNHITWIDAIVLQIACPRPIRFLVLEEIYRRRWLRPLLKAAGVVPIASHRARPALDAAVRLLRAGELVCLFPEGELTRTGTLLRLRRGFEWIAREADAPVVPVWLDDLWGSIFSFEGGRFFRKWPRRLPFRVMAAFGEPLAAAAADVALVRERLLALGEDCYQQRPTLEGHLGIACLRGLKRGLGRVALVDGLDESRLTRGEILAGAIALARHVRRTCPARRIGIALPPGRGAVIANLGVLLARKIPTNLNFTSGRAAIEASMRRGTIDTVLTARPVRERLKDFPWPNRVLELDALVPALRPRAAVWFALLHVLPWWAIAGLLRLPRRGDREEAALLFTSGSSGEPKGVPLTHRNLLGNITQFRLMLDLEETDVALCCLPVFHSFGCTVTLWYPLVEGVRMVTYPTPLDVVRNAALIERHGVTLFLSTPTFIRAYLRKARPEQLASIKLAITGAEKLPDELAHAFERRFGKPLLQGYGLTETSPVVSANLPDPARPDPDASVQPAQRLGSTGRMAPGIAAQIRDPESGRALSLHETGMLWLRGPNIFEGYLDEPECNARVVREGWFMTGDLGRFDDDGFLYIEGRLSRFSKIAGEMVPHETVERAVADALGLIQDEERQVAVVAVPDTVRGEALVLLSTVDIDRARLQADLVAAGIPRLWIPRIVRRVATIPVLSSGKLDMRRCRELAAGATG